MSKGWSDEAVMALRMLVTNPDLSYEQIGQDPRINKTRGAVCGKIDRLGLGRQSYAGAIKNKARIKAAAEVRENKARKAPALPATGDFRKIMAGHREAAAHRPLVALVDLGDTDCHFVFGDPKESREVYCGQPAMPGLRYCKACSGRMFETVEVVRHVPQRVKEFA